MGKFGMTEEQFEVFQARAIELHNRNAARHRREIVARAQARALPLASHDDATRAHVEQAVENGMTIAEFPTTREAAEASREGGLGRAGRRAQPGAGRLALRQHRRHRSAARRPGRHPVVGLCAGQPDGERLQAAGRRHRHRAARGGAAGLAQPRPAPSASATAARSPPTAAPTSCACATTTTRRWSAPCGAKASGWSRPCSPSPASDPPRAAGATHEYAGARRGSGRP